MNRRSLVVSPLLLLAVVYLGGLALGPRGQAQEAGPELAGYQGKWEGKVLFANGWRAQATVWLEPDKSGLTGRYELRPLDEEGPGAPRSGRLSVDVRGGEARLLDAARTLTFTGQLADAGSYAEAALLGSFAEGKQSGVFLLWRFRSR